MITLVIGGPDSGKSRFAESLADEGHHAGKYYIATMKIMDDDAKKRRDRHVAMRESKGFETLEIPYYIEIAPKLMRSPKKCMVLLECVANLVGNAMHEDEWKERLFAGAKEAADDFTASVIKKITDLADAVGHLIVVSSDYKVSDEDKKESPDAETQMYIDLLDAVNTRLKRIANEVYER